MSVRGFVVSLFAAFALLLVPAAGASAAPQLSTPTGLNKFGDVFVGETASMVFTYTSTGSNPVTIGESSIVEFAGNSEYFSITNDACAGKTRAIGQTCRVTVEFKPTAIGFRYTSMYVTSDDPASPHYFGIDGTGVNPGISVAPSTSEFGTVEIGSGNPSDQEVTITSTGTTELNATPIKIEGDDADDFTFYAGTPSCLYLNSPSSCPVRVRFNPTAGDSGTRSASLVIENNTKNDDPVTVPLTGTAVRAEYTTSPSSVAFGDVEVYGDPDLTRTVTVESNGTANLWFNASLSGANSNAFSLDTADCIALPSLPPEDSCDLVVTFKAGQFAPGLYSTSLQLFAANAPAQTLPVNATLVKGEASLGETSFTFDDTEVGHTRTGSLTLTSTGTAPLTFDTPEIGGADPDQFVVSLPASCLHLTNGQTCQVLVAFKPTKAAHSTAQVTLSGNFGTLDFGLSGRGNLAFLNLPGEIAFQQIPVGSEATQEVLLLSNGDAGFDLGGLSFEGVDAASFSAEPPASGCSDLVRGEECNITVTYSPTTVGSHVATLRIAGNLEGGAQTVPVFGSSRALAPAKLSLKLTKAKKVKRGKAIVLTTRVTNSGEVATPGVTLKAAVAKGKAKKITLVKVSPIKPGATVTKTIRINLKKAAKAGQSLKFTVKATAGSASASTTRLWRMRSRPEILWQ